MTEEAIHEAAFQIYWTFIRERDPERARQRWARIPERTRSQWIAEAKAAARVFDLYERNHAA